MGSNLQLELVTLTKRLAAQLQPHNEQIAVGDDRMHAHSQMASSEFSIVMGTANNEQGGPYDRISLVRLSSSASMRVCRSPSSLSTSTSVPA